MDNEKYLPELMAEKDSLDPSFQHSLRLLDQEIEKVQKDEDKEDEKFIDVVINKNMKLGQKVLIPVKQFPKFNFVGKLLGPRGNSLKRLQEDTLTKMSILGKGSMRDKEKEEELRKSGEAKYHHLNEDLHVLIEVFAPPAEAYARMGHALEEIKKFLIPDYNDEIRQAQLQELTYLNGGSEDAKVPAARGKSSTRCRGTPASGPHRCRGGVPPPQAAVPRGVAPRGAPPSRVPSSRVRGVPSQRARGAPPPPGYRPPPPVVQDTYGEYEYDDGYGTAYDDQAYDSYDNNYNNQAPNSDDYYEYSHGISGESYDSYGPEEWTNNCNKAPPARTSKGVYREQPYSRF
ncbi:KH domain-containing, RNA-binding, signal transduction-associated protein 3 isoform X1 [Cyprinus carpio]|uniref:KH domain-containing, RNA-binding, signal transduction-associated protein 3 isoform X1 n=2 Tax=Cyprinus carpio TaxID=7962 RepID=A0A9Q9XHL4_CYPCA|nr:KH domain-containing, RNA-binding, signal transduction-associated protein 3 isoform X1 [Cyprinus carpio]